MPSASVGRGRRVPLGGMGAPPTASGTPIGERRKQLPSTAWGRPCQLDCTRRPALEGHQKNRGAPYASGRPRKKNNQRCRLYPKHRLESRPRAQRGSPGIRSAQPDRFGPSGPTGARGPSMVTTDTPGPRSSSSSWPAGTTAGRSGRVSNGSAEGWIARPVRSRAAFTERTETASSGSSAGGTRRMAGGKRTSTRSSHSRRSASLAMPSSNQPGRLRRRSQQKPERAPRRRPPRTARPWASYWVASAGSCRA
jgi:hypothetical protein